MNTVIAFLALTFLALSTLLSEGQSRFFELSTKKGVAPLVVTMDARYLIESKNAEVLYWDFGDGEKLTTYDAKITHKYTVSGIYTVKLQYLKNKKDKVKNLKNGGTVQLTVLPNSNKLPVPLLSCALSSSNKIECDSNGSYDPDGAIVSYKINWGDGLSDNFTTSGARSHLYQTAGEKIVRLDVVDNNGGASFLEKRFMVNDNSTPIVAKINCVTNNLLVNCSALETLNPNNLPLRYTFNLGDGHSITNNTGLVSHAYSAPGTYEMTPSKEMLKSLGVIKLEPFSAETPFYPLDGYLEILIEKAKLNSQTNLNSFIINGNSLEKSNISYDFENNRVRIKSNLVDGSNEIEFLLYDELGKIINESLVVFAGSKTVRIDKGAAENISLNDLTFKIFAKVDGEAFSWELIKSNNDIANVPKLDFFVHAKNLEYSGTDMLLKRKNSVELDLHNFDVASSLNNNFSNGIEGWVIKNSNWSLERDKLTIQSNVSKKVILRKTIISQHANKFVSLPVEITSSSPNNYVSIVARNKDTKEVLVEYYRTSELGLGDGELTSSEVELPILSSNVGEVIEVEVCLFENSTEEPVSSYKKILDFIIPSAYASVSAFSASTNGVKGNTNIGVVTLKNKENKPIDHIGLGIYPKYFDSQNNQTLIPHPIK